MKVIGITGGIGAGKSTVSGYLASLGYPVFDADEVSRGLTAAGSPVVDELAETFGEEILVRKGVLSREKLAEIVFSDPDKNRKLMQIVTMKVREAGQKWISDYRKKEKYDIIILDIPLLFETGSEDLCDAVWFITADDEVRRRRVMERDGVTAEQVERRMRSQMPEKEKAERSDEIVDNSRGVEELHRTVDALLKKYDRTI
ncbi:MAG: dephospho-CoA kinase [Clostridiales bacterium]|nr:dephospho-CoA kinase [Clostridiales bacterium]